jgi:D-alanyl-D-alanine carboxypeptidase/D-alanyl-D-alanine-endopeptidase (penicillin-binding protein 4)
MSEFFRRSGLPVDDKMIPKTELQPLQPIYYHYSPGLDSLIDWFLKKSVNLYGEAFVRAIARQKGGDGSLEEGIDRIRKFWKDRGIEPGALRMLDGSGLSPQNRVTAGTLVQVLQYARRQWWFSQFLNSFPQYNNMTLKSGTIGGVKSFCGYHTTPEGKNLILALLVNNYEGNASTIVNKMFALFDELKK